jgi:hypothetical protein
MTAPVRSIRLKNQGTETLNRFTYEPGEVFWDAANNTLRVYNGSLTGGSILATRAWVLANGGGGGGGGSSTLDGLTDVVINTPLSGQVLKYNGTNWYNGQDDIGAGGSPPSNSFSQIVISGQPNVIATSPTDSLTLVAGNNITLTTNPFTDTITITAADQGTPTIPNSFASIAVAGQSNVDADNTADTLTLVAGSGISLTTDAITDSVTIAATGSVNTFGTIAVAGQSNVVADSSTDTLTLVAGANVTITTNATTDTITISATGGGGGSGTPGGSNTQVQFNNNGAFGGSANLTFDGTNLVVGGTVTATTLTSSGTGTPTFTSASDFIFSTGSSTGSMVVQGAVEASKFLRLAPLAAAPTGILAGVFAVADRTNWDPASKGTGGAYPVFYNGTSWNALY